MSRLRSTALPLVALVAAAAVTPPAAASGPQPLDTTGPVISVTAPSGDWQGWYAGAVTIDMRAVDGDGVERFGYSMRGAHTGTAWFDGTAGSLRIENPGRTEITLFATDGEGNESRRAVEFGVDAGAPTIEIGGTLVDGATVGRYQPRSLLFACQDEQTGISSCASAPHYTSGQNVDTTTPGEHTIVVTARDQVGRTHQRTVRYTVVIPRLDVRAGATITGYDGTPRIGDVLHGSGVEFNPAAESVTYRWHRNGTVVATGADYTLTAADLDQEIGLSAVGTRTGYEDTATGVHTIGPVERAVFAVSGPGRLVGVAQVGSTLRVVPPATVSPTPATTRYHWTVGAGAQAVETVTDEPTLALTAAHAGKPVSVRIRYQSPTHASWVAVTLDGTTTGATSTGPVRAAEVTPGPGTGTALAVLAASAVQGKARVGRTLRAVLPVLSAPATGWRFQWLRNGKPIKGATAATYRLRKADLRRKVTVRVTASAPNLPDVVSVAKAKRVRR